MLFRLLAIASMFPKNPIYFIRYIQINKNEMRVPH